MKLLFHRSENVVLKIIILPDKNGSIFQILKTQQVTNLDFHVPTVITQGKNIISKTQMESINYLGSLGKIIMLWLHTPVNILAKGWFLSRHGIYNNFTRNSQCLLFRYLECKKLV